jgi:hypothetical protein
VGKLPPVAEDFLCDALVSAGPVENHGWGPVSISPQRLESWSRLTGYSLSPWQAETLLDASRAYAAILNDKKAAAPWSAEVDKVKASNAVKAALRASRQGA